jgi:hypothetical protein
VITLLTLSLAGQDSRWTTLLQTHGNAIFVPNDTPSRPFFLSVRHTESEDEESSIEYLKHGGSQQRG